MTTTDRIDGLINNAFLNHKPEVMAALRYIRDDVAKLEADNERLEREVKESRSSSEPCNL